MANFSSPHGLSMPDGFDRDTFSSLLLTFGNVDYADQFFSKTFPKVKNYSDKFKILREFFTFNMIDSYSPEGQSEEDRAKSDYLFTLQHLLNKAKVIGIKGVIKN
ncbi:MAG: hypothetical protein LBB36_02865 [Fibromonadaceae bacterium]|jgi:hypothetical protein|nr:hypothetical protein [Fibromonadaceae bacterium]